MKWPLEEADPGVVFICTGKFGNNEIVLTEEERVVKKQDSDDVEDYFPHTRDLKLDIEEVGAKLSIFPDNKGNFNRFLAQFFG